MNAPSQSPDFDDLADDTEQARIFDQIWSLLRRSDAADPSSYDVDREWDRLADRLDLGADAADTAPGARAAGRGPRPNDAPATRRRRWTRALTAAVLVLLVVGAGAWWWSQPVSVRTAAGEQTVVALPDGSTAELNGATALSYPRGFSVLPGIEAPARRVTLDGEAFFSVTSRDRPFRVETANARVEVVGTKFSVRTRRAEGASETRVVVASGRVRVAASPDSSADRAGSVTLEKPGQSSRVRGTAPPTTPETVELKYVEAWRQGGFAVFDASLSTILRELERRFGVPLTLRVPAAETEPMSVHYAEDAQLKTVLRDICFTQNLSFRRTSQGYELVRPSD
ncbi:MAG: FecR family protein [Salinibacter sp.]